MTATRDNNDLTLSYEAPLEMAPEGRHPILCVDVFRTWPEEGTFDGKTKTYEKIMFVFQVFPEDGSRDSEGNVYRVEAKLTWSLDPMGKLRPFLEGWRGAPFPTLSVKVSPQDMVGKAAWGLLEHKTRYVRITAIEPHVDDNGNPLPPPQAESYKRRTYPNPEIWKNKQAQSATAASTTSPGRQNGASEPDEDLIPF